MTREWKRKFDLVDDEKEDTLTYHYKNTFIFRPDLSGPGLTGNELVVMPHPCKYEIPKIHKYLLKSGWELTFIYRSSFGWNVLNNERRQETDA